MYSPKQLGPVCVLTGIGAEPVKGRIIYNVPITVGTQTLLYTVCVAPVKDTCLLGLDFMTATSSILDLGNETSTTGEDIVPVNVTMIPKYQFSKVTVVRRIVVQPHSVGFVKAELDISIDGPYIVEGCPTKHVLSSRIYGQGKSVALKVIGLRLFRNKKGKKIGHAESAAQVSENDEKISWECQTEPEQAYVYRSKNEDTQEEDQSRDSQEQTDKGDQDIHSHVQQIYLNNVSELSVDQRSKFKKLVT